MGKFRRGQAALEFLTTYGWAFLVILVMIGGLSYFGVLDISRFIPDSCKLDGNIECGAIALYNNSVDMNVKNNVGERINITQIRFREKTQEASNANDWCEVNITYPVAGFEVTQTDNEIARNQNMDFTGAAGIFGTNAVGEWAQCGLDDVPIGDKKSYLVEVFYTKGDSSIRSLASGSFTTTLQPNKP